MGSPAERGHTPEEQGQINHEAGGLIRRLDIRLQQSPQACTASMVAWLYDRDFILFDVEKAGGPDNASSIDSFKIDRRFIKFGKGNIGGSFRRVELISTDGAIETMSRLLTTRFDEPTPESGLLYVRRVKVDGKVTERVILKDLDAAHEGAKLIDSIPTGPITSPGVAYVALSLMHSKV